MKFFQRRLERDEVGQREGDHEAQDGRGRRVADRAQELRVVLADGVRVVRERPREDVAGLRVAGLQRDVELVHQRDREEHDQPRQPRSKEQPGEELAAALERQPQQS